MILQVTNGVSVLLQVFKPMAECASQVIEANGMASKINIIEKRSTEVTVGPGNLSLPLNVSSTNVCL